MQVITEPEKAILRVIFPLYKPYAYSLYRWVLEFHSTLDLEDPGIPGIRNMGLLKSQPLGPRGDRLINSPGVDISIVIYCKDSLWRVG